MNGMGKLCRTGLVALGLILAAALTAGPALAAKAAETVYLNGNIYTVDAKQPKATAVAIAGQKLVYVGSDKGAKAYVGKTTKVVDLKGKTVLPGLIEGHMHYTGEGQKMLQVYVFWSPKAEILAKVKAETEKLPAGTWIIGRGWNQEVWPDKKFPTKEELDAVAPNHPVVPRHLGQLQGARHGGRRQEHPQSRRRHDRPGRRRQPHGHPPRDGAQPRPQQDHAHDE